MKFRSANVSLYLNELRAKGYEVVSVTEERAPRKKNITYVLVNPQLKRRATVYKTGNSWLEITYSELK